MLRKRIILPAVILIAAYIVLALYMVGDYQENRSTLLQSHTAKQQLSWNAVLRIHESGMLAYFDAYILQPDVIALLQRAYRSDNKNEIDETRNRLYQLLLPFYDAMRQGKSIELLHFHDSKSHTFLRFHAPESFGDPLYHIRPSVRQANETLQPQNGFEIGRLSSGFRHVFPIYRYGEHLGSVELSQPFDGLRTEIDRLDDSREYLLFVKREELEAKSFPAELAKYTTTPFSDRWLVRKESNTLLPDRGAVDLDSLPQNVDKTIEQLFDNGKAAARDIRFGKDRRIITVTPIINTEGVNVAFLLSITPADELVAHTNRFAIVLAGLSLGTAMLLGTLWWLLQSLLRQSAAEQRFRAMAESILEGLYVMDRAGSITYTNPAAARLLGHSREVMQGREAHALFHAHALNDNMPIEKCPIFNTVQHQRHYQGDELFMSKDGTIFTARVSSQPLIENGEVTGSITAFEDVTEQSQLERRIQESEEKFRSLFTESRNPLVIMDADSLEFLDCNQAAVEILGYKEVEEVLGLSPLEVSPSEQPDGSPSQSRIYRYVLQSMERGEVLFEWQLRRPSGEAWDAAIHLMLIEQGNRSLLQFNLNDITQRKIVEEKLRQREEDLRQLNASLQLQVEAAISHNRNQDQIIFEQSRREELSTLLVNLAHQWRQPLNSIGVVVQRLSEEHEEGELTAELMHNHVTTVMEQILELSATLSRFTRIYESNDTIEPVNLLAMVEQLKELLQLSLNASFVSIETSIDPDLYVSANQLDIIEILIRFVRSCVRHAIEKGQRGLHIEIEAEKEVIDDQDALIIRIKDDSGGMAPDEMAGFWTTSHGGDSVENRKGLALYLTIRMIEQRYNGSVGMENLEKGVGFTIILKPLLSPAK